MPFFRYFFLACLFVSLLVIGWAGFRGEKSTKPPLMVFPDMDDQPKIKFQAGSEFFPDGRGARPPVAGTVPMGLAMATKRAVEADKESALGFTIGNDYYHTGRFGDYWGDGIPEQIAVNEALLRRGGERYGIYCAPCHGLAGDAQGITSKYGVNAIANFHLPPFADPKDPTFRTDGSMFATVTYGKGQMGPYGAVIPVPDRWAIIAYIRTLQIAKAESAPKPGATPAPPAGTPPPATTPPTPPPAGGQPATPSTQPPAAQPAPAPPVPSPPAQPAAPGVVK
jgi:mono/diheme cytochrome c family protein